MDDVSEADARGEFGATEQSGQLATDERGATEKYGAPAGDAGDSSQVRMDRIEAYGEQVAILASLETELLKEKRRRSQADYGEIWVRWHP